MYTGGKSHFLQGFLRKYENVGNKHPVPIIIAFLFIGIFFLNGALKVDVDYDMIKIIKEGTPIRDTYELVDKYMGGTGNMEILIDTGQIDAMKTPGILNAMDILQTYIEEKHNDLVVETASLVNVTKDSFKVLNEGRPDMYIIPQDPNVLAQTLFLFGNANPKDRRQLVSDDFRIGRIGINVINKGSKGAIRFMEDVHAFSDQIFDPLKKTYPDLKVTLTGQLSLISMVIDYLSWSQIKSFGLSLIVISLLLLVVLGSRKVGLIAIFPNVFPIFIIFGIMGYLKIPLDTDTLLIAPIIIGIAVDDTIHFLTHFRMDMKKYNNMEMAITHTIREAGQAIVFTSIILSVGFLIFLLSIHKGLSNFGIFSAIAIITALLADIFLLPAMLTFFNATPENSLSEEQNGGTK